ncbi:MAG TPA: hypothetical protein VGK06_04155 [Methanosarcina sp.]
MTIKQIKQNIAELKKAINVKRETPSALVIFVDENQEIVEIQGYDITCCTEAEINEILDPVPVHYYLPESNPEDLE